MSDDAAIRLVFVNRYFYPDHSATSQLLTDLSFALVAMGREVHVVTSYQRYDDAAASLPLHEHIRGVEVHRVRTTRFGRGNLLGRALDYASFYLAASWRLWRITRARDVIIAKTDPPLICVVAGQVARWRGARLVNWVQDVFPELASALGVRGFSGMMTGWLRQLRDAAFKLAVANVVLSESMATVVARVAGGAGSIHVIPNWADMEDIHPIPISDNPLRGEWGLDGKFVVCYSGNMGRAHEFETILGAAQRLARARKDIAFLFIGGGAQRGMIEGEVRRMALTNVQFRPYQDRHDLSFSLGLGDVHLVSQRPEVEGYVYPSKLYGILAAGRPLVFIGDLQGEIGLLVAREGIGVGVRQGDAAGLADQLAQLADDNILREKMGARARALLCKRYDKRLAFTAWQELLEKL